jgi:hypothetical protein
MMVFGRSGSYFSCTGGGIPARDVQDRHVHCGWMMMMGMPTSMNGMPMSSSNHA